MQGEVNIVNVNIVIALQFFNTPGTEVAPGSNKIGVDIEGDRISHFILRYRLGITTLFTATQIFAQLRSYKTKCTQLLME